MARVREFQCDMCGGHEKTTEAQKPKTWLHLKTRGRGNLPGSVKETAIVCADCAAAIDKAASDLVTLIQVTIVSRKSDAVPTLTDGQMLSVMHKKALEDLDAFDPMMNEDEGDDHEDIIAGRRKLARKKRRGTAEEEDDD